MKIFLSNLKIASDTPYVYLTVHIDRGNFDSDLLKRVLTGHQRNQDGR